MHFSFQNINFCCLQDTRSENQLNRLNTAEVLRATDNKMLKLFASQQNINAKIENSQMQPNAYQVKLSKR